MNRLAKLTLAEVLPHIGKTDRIMHDGNELSVQSLRMMTFRHKGTACVQCGIVGSFFFAERQEWFSRKHSIPYTGKYHLNLYGIDDHGNAVLMTHDHIIPVSLGGANNLTNSTTMCTKCNRTKANTMPSQQFISKHGGAMASARELNAPVSKKQFYPNPNKKVCHHVAEIA